MNRFEFRFMLWFIAWLALLGHATPKPTGWQLFVGFILAALSAEWLRPTAYREWKRDRARNRFERAYRRGVRQRGDGEL